jgi:hypothetical protein
VARVDMQDRSGNWVPCTVPGLRVIFQLVAVRADPATSPPPPPYLAALGLRDQTRVTGFNDVFAPTPAAAAPTGGVGPRGYLKAVHDRYNTAASTDSDPTWWNSPLELGGKRSNTTNVAGSILAVGANAAALGVPTAVQPQFPWSSEDATVSQPASTVQHHAAVSVPIVSGKAALVFTPSRLGGDSYKVRAFIDSPAPPAVPGQAPAILADVTSGVLTIWRRLRVTRHMQRGAPSTWSAQQISESGGALAPIDWSAMSGLFKKAFVQLEPPGAAISITTDMRDKAVLGAIQLLKTICPSTPGHPTTFVPLLRRVFGSATLADPSAPFDPDRFFRSGVDSPHFLDWNVPAEYDAATAAAGTESIGEWPWKTFFAGGWIRPGLFQNPIVDSLSDAIAQLASLFLEGFDPAHPELFDAVPVPGITIVHSLFYSNVRAVGTPEAILGLDGPWPSSTPARTDLARLIHGLAAGDKISVKRYREQDVRALTAAQPWASDPGANPQASPAQIRGLTALARIDFVYGTDGRTLGELTQFLQTQTSAGGLARTAAAGGTGEPPITFTPSARFGAPPASGLTTHPARIGTLRFVFRMAVAKSAWLGDGLRLELVTSRGTGPDTPIPGWTMKTLPYPPFLLGGRSMNPRGDLMVQTDRNSFAGGHTANTRTIFLVGGADGYANAGPSAGPAPTPPGGRGFVVPGLLQYYDFASTCAHELGHANMLRHQYNGRSASYGRDHDHNDVCIMSYMTGFALVGGAFALSVPEADILAGTNRDAGRADYCGRCCLKLRGWQMREDRLPNNHAPLTGTPAVMQGTVPTTSATHIGD